MNFLSNIKYTLFILITGICIGATACGFVIYKMQPKSDPSAKITTQTIKGSPVEIKNIISSNGKTVIDATYGGAGESTITIPADSIPEAYNWRHYVWGVGGSISTDLTASFLVSYRYERIQGIGSVWFRNNNGYNVGISLGAMYLF